MCIKKTYLILILLLFSVGIVHSQENRSGIDYSSRAIGDIVYADTLLDITRINRRYENIEVHFKLDKHNLELDYLGNEASLQHFARKVDSIGISMIDSIIIVSQSSPEGPYEHNLELSLNRARTMHNTILARHPELSNKLYVYPDGESWAQLREYVKNDTVMNESSIEKVISIIDSDISINTKKARMKQLPEYRYLLKKYYPIIRNSSFYILYYSDIQTEKILEHILEIPDYEPEPVVDVIDLGPDTTLVVAPMALPEEEWNRKLYLKTNAIGLGMAITNLAAEIDLAKHWSFSLPIYYSAWNYFKTTIKFRTLAVQPEFRYWPSKYNDGFFVGAHFGMVYYNFAFDGPYRYQDHDGTTPALGGGLNLGYRLPISKNDRWKMEFSVGAGVYPLYYDIFHNPPVTENGLMTKSVRKTYWGIDQAAISFSYMFDLKKKGGKR